jgi:hypothetical protein
VVSLVYLTAHLHSQMAADLTLAGYRVWKALDFPEVLFFCEHQDVDMVVIAPDAEDADAVELQMRPITLRLNPGVTAAGVMWELGLLYRGSARPSVH